MVTYCFRISGSYADLVIERLAVVVPHAHQPIHSEPGFSSEVGSPCSHLARKIADSNQQHRHCITVSLHKLDVVTSVPPRARSIYPNSQRAQIAREAATAIRVGC